MTLEQGRVRKVFEVHDRTSLDCLEEIVSRNMNAKCSSSEVTRRYEGCDFGNAFGEATLIINWQKTWLNSVLLGES